MYHFPKIDGYKGDGFTCKQWLFGITEKPKSDADASNVWMDIHENSLERTSGGGFSFIEDFQEDATGLAGRMADCNEKCGENASCIAKKCKCNVGYVGNGMFCIPAGFGDMEVGKVTTEAATTQTGNAFYCRNHYFCQVQQSSQNASEKKRLTSVKVASVRCRQLLKGTVARQ